MDAGMDGGGPASGGWPLMLILAATFLVRAIGPGQPIVENYVGRQVPTAMVARNLERGSGWFRPRLDTAPVPNYFVVEPPLYEWGVVALRRATGLGLEESGRLLSAIATAAAGWGIFELTRRRRGRRAALLAAGAFAAFPLTIRYGRAFQPDAAMLGAVAAGLACWDRSGGSWRAAAGAGRPMWLAAGWTLLSVGLAIKVIAAPLVIAMTAILPPTRRYRAFIAAGAAVVPALLWYAWASHLVGAEGGSRASADNRAIWLGLLAPSAWIRPESWAPALRFLLVRAFTPLGAALAILGLVGGRRGLGLWRAWGLVALATLGLLMPKLHHEYYFLILAPAVAAGVGIALDRLADARRGAAIGAAACLLLLSVLQSRSTWRTPPEWADLGAAARAVEAATPAGEWVVAPEALLFASDRRGCRLEWTEPSARRAAGEWGDEAAAAVRGPIDLVEHYRRRGARYFADLGDRAADARRMALHDAVRRRYKVIIDRPEVLIADLRSVASPGMLPHAN
jgi:4-amino-4-deoxy-L-arabinose transferase-like glycosyltransferase